MCFWQNTGDLFVHFQLFQLQFVQQCRSIFTELLQSPPGMSAADRFSSPTPGSAKRRLFSSGAVPGNATTLATPSPTSVENPPAGTSNQSQPVIFQQAQMEDGRQVLSKVNIIFKMLYETWTGVELCKFY